MLNVFLLIICLTGAVHTFPLLIHTDIQHNKQNQLWLWLWLWFSSLWCINGKFHTLILLTVCFWSFPGLHVWLSRGLWKHLQSQQSGQKEDTGETGRSACHSLCHIGRVPRGQIQEVSQKRSGFTDYNTPQPQAVTQFIRNTWTKTVGCVTVAETLDLG